MSRHIAKRGADGFYALRLSRLLHLRFDKWEAYKLGIIDADGNKLKDAETGFEKSNWTLFHVTVRNIKRLINKLPGGKTALDYGASYLLLLELAKEYNLSDEFPALCQELSEAVVAGDAGDGTGSPESIASGETTGAVTNAGPGISTKKKIKKFRHFKSKTKKAQ